MVQGWDGRVPVCEGKPNPRGGVVKGNVCFFPSVTLNAAARLPAIDCGEPPKVVNAELKDSLEPSHTYRSVVRYHCRVGTLLGSMEVWCTQDGTWSTPPTCRGASQKSVGEQRLLSVLTTFIFIPKKLFIFPPHKGASPRRRL